MHTRIAAILTLFLSLPAFGAARHVYLNTTGSGGLNDCPNPTHAFDGTTNKAKLFYCFGGSTNATVKRIICDAGATCKAWTTTSSACTAAGGSPTTTVTNDTSINIEATGTGAESDITVYGHPQACVWNMAKSDSCEVHSGTYRAAGGQADADALQHIASTGGSCGKQNCWKATVLAYGYGPNLASAGYPGYGTLASPGYLRGAVFNGSTDTWDSDGDKVPDTVAGEPTSYPVIFSGDVNADGIFDSSSGTTTTVTGDAFYGVQIGCNSGSYDFCSSSETSPVAIDTDANGSLENQTVNGNAKNVSYLRVKDIEFTGYNGGHSFTSSGARSREGIIGLEGNGASDGLIVDHVYVHGNDYTLQASNENYWSIFSDSHNAGCSSKTEIENSYLEQNNEKVVDDDCGVGNQCGCPKSVHDNHFVRNITSARSSGRSLIVFFYFKSIDTFSGGKKVHRIYNNVFDQLAQAGGSGKLMDLQAFGNSIGAGTGELWIYGNLFRNLGSVKMDRMWLGSCGIGTGSGRLYWINNTFDGTFNSNTDGMYQACFGDTEEFVFEGNNAFWSGSTDINPHANVATTEIQANEYCSAASTACNTPGQVTHAQWFFSTSSTLNDWASGSRALAGGPLDENGDCNLPGPDGTTFGAGMDYDGDGVRDTQWTDLAGNTVKCPTTITTLDVGAVQSSSDAGAVCGNSLTESPEVCDDGNTVTETACNYGTPSCTLCNAACSATLSLTGAYCGDSTLNGSEFCDTGAGYVLPTNCVGLGFTGGTLTCASNCLSYNTSGCTVTTPGKTANALTLRGGTIH